MRRWRPRERRRRPTEAEVYLPHDTILGDAWQQYLGRAQVARRRQLRGRIVARPCRRHRLRARRLRRAAARRAEDCRARVLARRRWRASRRARAHPAEGDGALGARHTAGVDGVGRVDREFARLLEAARGIERALGALRREGRCGAHDARALAVELRRRARLKMEGSAEASSAKESEVRGRRMEARQFNQWMGEWKAVDGWVEGQ